MKAAGRVVLRDVPRSAPPPMVRRMSVSAIHGLVALHLNVEVVLQRQLDRILQAQHQLSVLNELVDPRRVRELWLRHLTRLIGRQHVWKPRRGGSE